MKVIGNKILIKVQKEEASQKTASGLIMPTNLKNPGIETAEVISVGDGEDVSSLKVGDKMFIHMGYGSEFTNPADDEKYRVMDPSGIIVILD